MSGCACQVEPGQQSLLHFPRSWQKKRPPPQVGYTPINQVPPSRKRPVCISSVLRPNRGGGDPSAPSAANLCFVKYKPKRRFFSVPAAFSRQISQKRKLFKAKTEAVHAAEPPPTWNTAAAVAALEKLIIFMHSYKGNSWSTLNRAVFLAADASTGKEGGQQPGTAGQMFSVRQGGQVLVRNKQL